MADADSTRDERLRQRNFEATTFSYLKRHYFDAKQLRRRTMDEFVRAARTGRLIAFTGSMTSEDRGYHQWDAFAKECFSQAATNFKEHLKSHDDNINDLKNIVLKFGDIVNPKDEASKARSKKIGLDKRVAFSIIGETLDLANHYSRLNLINPNKDISEALFLSIPRHDVSDRNIIRALLNELNIDRVITLNYDFELELEYAHRTRPLATAKSSERNAPKVLGRFDHDPRTQQIVKRLPGARSLASDIFNRERTDTLIEFAVGSADHEYHVLHLHGRADAFDSMVVSYRDYDRLYRKSGLSKAPFEHALKLLYAGNPILFVGLGMNEAEVNATLQDFVGDHPYRRITPTFLLWNSPLDDRHRPDEVACEIKRIDMLHRLGVLTIFDHEIGTGLTELPDIEGDSEPRGRKLERVRRSIENLAVELTNSEAKRLSTITGWRSLSSRARSQAKIIGTWNVELDEGDVPSRLLAEHSLDTPLTVVEGRSGTHKGREARRTARDWSLAHPSGTVLLINAEFAFDTDTLLNLVCEFLKARYPSERGAGLTRVSRNEVFRRHDAFTVAEDRPVLIVFSGIERLFGTNGEPLSAEFDDLLRAFVAAQLPDKRNGAPSTANVRLLAFATPRNDSYWRGLVPENYTHILKRILWQPGGDQYEPSTYLAEIAKHLATVPFIVPGLLLGQKSSPAIELAAYRRAFFAAHLDPRHLEAAGVAPGRGPLTLDILTVMAQIGQPVEREVLYIAPRVRHRLGQIAEPGESAQQKAFKETIDWLEQVNLVIPVKGFDGRRPASAKRYGLHATLLAELRERSGVPLSEAVLSTAFNMSLYTAQPTDGPLPEAFLHDELGQLIDWMIGAYRDAPLDPAAAPPANPRHRPEALAALRAALAIIRGFYSTTALLTLEGKDRSIGAERDGALTEHAERLERLLLAFQLTLPIPETADGPFYADEIVWLYNEIGVVRLAQGSLYDARFAFDEADRINREYVEFNDRGHNWRRITLNQIVVDIERARLDSAERRLKQIEDGIDPDKRERIAKIVAGPGPCPPPTDSLVSHEEFLAIGLVAGYRGLCAHIAGKAVEAAEHFLTAIDILRRLDERRAYATFQRHYAALAHEILSPEAANVELDLSIRAAESVRQMDLIQQACLMRAQRTVASRSIDELVRANQQMMDALTYADVTDTYRVRVEARASLAHIRMASGDIEAALEHATDALTVATRHGQSLRKITLRILIGSILIRRGDPMSGRALIERGKAAAIRVGYQRATALAQTVLMGT
jgi:tetratricopeptide (TPR) repeat protein